MTKILIILIISALCQTVSAKGSGGHGRRGKGKGNTHQFIPWKHKKIN